MNTNRHEFHKAILSHSSLQCAADNLENLSLEQQYLALIRVHSWLKAKAQHLDSGGDFDVLVAYDEIQRAGG